MENITRNSFELLTYRQVAGRFNIGLTSAQHIAKKSGALRKIGKCARVDITVLKNYLDQQAQ